MIVEYVFCDGSQRHAIICLDCNRVVVTCGCSEAVGKDGYWCECGPNNPDRIGEEDWWGLSYFSQIV